MICAKNFQFTHNTTGEYMRLSYRFLPYVMLLCIPTVSAVADKGLEVYMLNS